ncbi:23S rRNA (cytosine(1962)-C(5))-methyltransferase RlmI [Victivallaceae bacterium BBE-744-WT-12]|uniref:23S rRNA (Cytosine(1962)-C(5))-methyltransferase RlmI n=1 Tax=Victivallis lenta TaxID=2606640 RepID=A0A844G6J2_9BACT|nr:class I SAM-dependent methyltransferase [Victivallis lenta]MST99520.1 23S rRNA (cytosine(1962)-C(5))-methyltransferase RlmI [Victivallis lenta]
MPLELILKEGREKSLLRRHPWVFSGAVAEINGEPVKGADVVIGDSKHHFLALASLSPESRLTARVWTFQEDEAVDQAFFDRRFQKAFKLRKAAFGALPDAFRLINAESDGLPGVIVDIYGDYAVCQLSSAGADFHRAEIANAALHYAKGVYERSDVDSRIKEGLEPSCGPLAGEELPATIEFTENGVRYSMNPRTGHKTGFYLDQRLSRLAVMNAAKDAENVLNCFCYTGGFGLAAVRGGGTQTICSKKCTPDALVAIPKGMEIVESPNGKVSCRKKQQSAILRQERDLLEKWIPKLSKQAFVKIEVKPKELIVHGTETARYKSLPIGIPLEGALKLLEKFVVYEPFFKFELDDSDARLFSVSRMCYMTIDGEWMYLESGSLEALAKKYLPHVGKESFFELE